MMIDKYGILTKTPNTGQPMQSPYLPVVNRQAHIMLKAAEQLGFTPAARSRVQVEETPFLDPNDRWARLARGQRLATCGSRRPV